MSVLKLVLGDISPFSARSRLSHILHLFYRIAHPLLRSANAPRHRLRIRPQALSGPLAHLFLALSVLCPVAHISDTASTTPHGKVTA